MKIIIKFVGYILRNLTSYGRRSHRSGLKKCFTFICKRLIVPKTMSYFLIALISKIPIIV